ncbi:M1 family metallopeptidase, partial [Bacteroidota bacterium]
TVSNAGEGRAIIEIPSDQPEMKKYSALNRDTLNELKQIIITYEGIINQEINSTQNEYSRSFSETDGLINKKGVYLAGATVWVPYVQDQLFDYILETKINKGYGVVSQGMRTRNEEIGEYNYVSYTCNFPMEEVYLIAGPWTEYNLSLGKVLVQAFLRKPDKELADKYLGVTSTYLQRYESMIGPYPFTKFALVENFWETGYGMPSFTLLGEKVIRFPWILHSSYPHELLHNWWGNSVYVDYDSGNWCEGITAYMADQLNKELVGEGPVYRRETLQKYTDYVNSGRDFPLKDFHSRHSAAEEAIGYGKSLMVYHMLRTEYGDEAFLKAWQHFYTNNKFKAASWDDIRQSFEYASGADLTAYFDQWINRTGAPEISLSDVLVKSADKFNLSFKLSQVQPEDAFSIIIPVAIYLEGENEARIINLRMDKKSQVFEYTFSSKPLRIEVDPYFDVFRRLNRKEVPATLSRVLGSEDIAIVVPFNDKFAVEYLELANEWKKTLSKDGKKVRVTYDRDVSNVPEEKALWIFGYGSKYGVFTSIANQYKKLLNAEETAVWEEMEKNGSLVYVFSNPDDAAQTFAFLGVNDVYAISSLNTKIPHYGKYSYLGFESKHSVNKLKGIFQVLDSPMVFNLKYTSGTPAVAAKLPVRKSLVNN